MTAIYWQTLNSCFGTALLICLCMFTIPLFNMSSIGTVISLPNPPPPTHPQAIMWIHNTLFECFTFKHRSEFMVQLSYFSFQPVIHDWCNKGCGMCYPVCGMMHIKEPLLLIGKSSPCGSSGIPFLLSEWSSTICLTPYNRK